MAMKSANVTARVEPEVKQQAEAIMSRLGIPASTAINMFYRQIVLWNGLPFRPAIPSQRPPTREELSKEEFDARMSIGFEQARNGQSAPAEEVFARLLGNLTNG